MSNEWKKHKEYTDSVLPDVNKLVYERKSSMSHIRIMGTVGGYYYIEMGDKVNFKLDSLTLDELKQLAKALIKEISESEESL